MHYELPTYYENKLRELMERQITSSLMLPPVKSEIKTIDVKLGEKMTREENLQTKNKKYEVEIYNYDENNCRQKSHVRIVCDNYETFSKIVEAVNPILEEECKNK